VPAAGDEGGTATSVAASSDSGELDFISMLRCYQPDRKQSCPRFIRILGLQPFKDGRN
jgi:hypothetical protein